MKRANALVIEAERTAYSIEQLRGAVTVGDLKMFLEGRDDNEWIVLSHDNGYTYGTLSRSVSVREYDEDEEEYSEDEYSDYINHYEFYDEEE
jgi:hypothetical protein